MKSTKDKSAEYYQKHKETKLRVNERWRQRNKERDKEMKRDYHLRKHFNISSKDYDLLLKKQNNLCAICFKDCPTKRALAVDHDHLTDQIRGLLCVNCNKGLGLFKDNIHLLESAKLYLLRA